MITRRLTKLPRFLRETLRTFFTGDRTPRRFVTQSLHTLSLIVFFGGVALAQNSATKPTALSLNQVTPANTTTSVSPSTPNTESNGLKRARIALAEYGKGVKERVPGCNCGQAVDVYTGGNPVQWCTAFASWVAQQAGTPVRNPDTHGWRIFNSQKFMAILQTNHAFYSKQDLIDKKTTPQIGDFVISWRGNYAEKLGHVDIIVKLNPNGTADLVGGNVGNAISYRANYPYLDSYGFQGIGRP